MKNLILALFFLLIMINLNCGDSKRNPTLSEPADVIQPLGIGEKRYATVYLDYGDGFPDTMTDMFSIERTVMVNNEKWSVVSFSLDGSLIGEALMTNRNDGLWFWSTDPDSITGSPYLWILYPASVNDIYTKEGNPYEQIVVVANDTAITVPHGDFNCYCYRGSSFNDDILSYRFYAPNIGLVKIHTYNSFVEPPMTSVWMLDSIVTD